MNNFTKRNINYVDPKSELIIFKLNAEQFSEISEALGISEEQNDSAVAEQFNENTN